MAPRPNVGPVRGEERPGGGLTVPSNRMPFIWQHNVSAAAWLEERMHPFGQDTGSVVPTGFERYARIFHPIERGDTIERWSEVAAGNGRLVHPEMQLHMISAPAGVPSPDARDPGLGFRSGSLRPEERAPLAEHLRTATATPDDCCYCVWEGFGIKDHGVKERVELPARSYLFARGPLDDVLRSASQRWDQSPNLWWPADRAWVVATEVDFAWTYVGGSSELIRRLLGDTRLEALVALLSDKPFYDSDILNAALDG